jgi:hypothetical protein
MQSVLRGLRQLNYTDYKINPAMGEIHNGDTIWVNESLLALREVIELKKHFIKSGKKVKLVAGPNLVVHPNDNDNIIYDENIDIILQPSEWTKKFYEESVPGPTKNIVKVREKIKVWAAGVEDTFEDLNGTNRNEIIIYQKNAPSEILETVEDTLREKKLPYAVVKYGSYKHSVFLNRLNNTKGLVFLSTSESQGITLNEAWIRNVPTLVWDRGFWQRNNITFHHLKISCPYLNDKTGLTFQNTVDFSEKFDRFLEQISSYRPREYSLENFTDKVTTRKYLDIMGT